MSGASFFQNQTLGAILASIFMYIANSFKDFAQIFDKSKLEALTLPHHHWFLLTFANPVNTYVILKAWFEPQFFVQW